MIQAVVTDVEGTTSSLAFVKEVLFPYARAHLAGYIARHREDPRVARELAAIRSQAGSDLSEERLIAILLQWIDEDRKETPLKALQGMIWECGYHAGELQGHIYEDAVRKLREWHAEGLKLFVFSSGSVQAQRLLFGHTLYGDLTPLFTDYFDTRIGAKRDPAAYRRIADRIGHPPATILFLSDTAAELDAAHATGFAVCQLVREPGQQSAGAYPSARNFDEIIVCQNEIV